jgi:hypothetical protein
MSLVYVQFVLKLDNISVSKGKADYLIHHGNHGFLK